MTTLDKLSNRELIDHVYSEMAGAKIRESITDLGNTAKWKQVVGQMAQPVGLVYRIGILNLQVFNGGFIQYFDNGYGVFAYETLKDLKTVGANLSFEILKNVLDIVNYRKLSVEQFVEFVKQRKYDEDPTIADRLDKMDTQFDSLEGQEDLEQLVGNYLRKHLSDIN